MVQDIYSGLDVEDGKAKDPADSFFSTTLRELRLFEETTYIKEYYLTNAKTEVLTDYPRGQDFRDGIPENAQLVELGSGCVS